MHFAHVCNRGAGDVDGVGWLQPGKFDSINLLATSQLVGQQVLQYVIVLEVAAILSSLESLCDPGKLPQRKERT